LPSPVSSISPHLLLAIGSKSDGPIRRP
jgi:hypothetical protein